MRPIPEKVKEQLSNDTFMKKCCFCGTARLRIEWHHNLIYQGRQSDIPESILPLCSFCHAIADDSGVKEKLDLIMLKRMGTEQIKSISKAINYKQRLSYLKKKYEC